MLRRPARSPMITAALGMLAAILAIAPAAWAADNTPTQTAALVAANRTVASNTRSRAATPPPVERRLTITVLWDDAMTTRESGLWIGYLFARMEFVSHNGGRYSRVPGVITPIFDEEVFARGEAAKIYRDMRSNGKGTDSDYFNALDRVDAAGYMREYVWQYLHRDEWGAAPTGLRSDEFARWARANLSGHAPETRGRVAFQTGTTAGS